MSPTQGVVISAVDGLPDMDIGKSDRDNPAGNHVILETVDGVRLLLAHLRQGSIVVHEGRRVDAGQVLAQVGNSGNSSEPHLHIQAMMRTENGTWIGIPLKIQGRILHRGQLLRSSQ
ncbi:MAG TPA: M23 family metallopeptidase [Firmicutes bacterium]|nr:M23 family metallopeptidase [Candidatus Fermentithermobacillaceae bacterium]